MVVRTNYATNLETPRAIGADLDVVDLALRRRLAARRRAGGRRACATGTTRLISVTRPHNPTGTMFDRATLDALVELAERSGAVLLVDETYRDLTHGEPLPLAATLSPRVISVSSMSKAYGLPGLRIGWAVCRDPALAETLLAAKEQMLICGATLDERIAGSVLAGAGRRPPADPRRRARPARIVRDWMAGPVDLRVGRARGRRGRASCGSAPRSRSTPTASTRRCSPTTAPTSAPATGSSSTTATSASASAGPPTTSSAPAWPACRRGRDDRYRMSWRTSRSTSGL